MRKQRNDTAAVAPGDLLAGPRVDIGNAIADIDKRLHGDLDLGDEIILRAQVAGLQLALAYVCKALLEVGGDS